MIAENTDWGTWKIYCELCLLGYFWEVSHSTVKNYLKGYGPRLKTDPKLIKNWLTFLHNHSKEIASVDFGSVITASFKRIYFFVVLSNERRKILFFNVCQYPCQSWVIQQMKNTFFDNQIPKYLIRDRDPVYSSNFNNIIERGFRIKQVKTTPYSPWQNPYVERLIGTIRRECLDQMLIFNEEHLRRILKEYIHYYNNFRPHMVLNNSPVKRKIQNKKDGIIVSIPVLGGIYHVYQRKAA